MCKAKTLEFISTSGVVRAACRVRAVVDWPPYRPGPEPVALGQWVQLQYLTVAVCSAGHPLSTLPKVLYLQYV